MWEIRSGQYGGTDLGGTRFAIYYDFPGPVEEGQGTACAYVDSHATTEQRQALDAIACGQAGGGIFEFFGEQLVKSWLPTRFVPIAFEFDDGVGRVRIGDVAGADSKLLSDPDGSTIRPNMPHKPNLTRASKAWRVVRD